MTNNLDPATIGFETCGVLPLEEALPWFSPIQDKMPVMPDGHRMTYQDWCNSFLAQLNLYAAQCKSASRLPTMYEFSKTPAAATNNSSTTMANLGGIIRKYSGLPGGKGRQMVVYPVSLTKLGAENVINEYSRTVGRHKEGKVQYTKQELVMLGRLVVENGYQLYDPATEFMIDPRTLINRV